MAAIKSLVPSMMPAKRSLENRSVLWAVSKYLLTISRSNVRSSTRRSRSARASRRACSISFWALTSRKVMMPRIGRPSPPSTGANEKEPVQFVPVSRRSIRAS